MEQASSLTDAGKAVTPTRTALQRAGKAQAATAREIGKSRRVVQNYLRSLSTYGTNKSNGRPRKISQRTAMHNCRLTSKSTISCEEIRSSSVTKRSSIWTGQMDLTVIGMMYVNSRGTSQSATSVAGPLWLGELSPLSADSYSLLSHLE